MNQTGGLFGGLLIVSAIGAAVVWTVPAARAWAVGLLGGAGAAATSPSGASPAPPTGGSSSGANGGGWGNFNAGKAVPSSTTQPYQLVYNPTTGIGISTAAQIPINEAPAIALPTASPLAPTSSALVWA